MKLCLFFPEVDSRMKIIVDYSQAFLFDENLPFKPSRFEAKIHDIMAFKGRSFKPGWGKGMSLITRAKCDEDSDGIINTLEFTSPMIEIVKITNTDKFNNRDYIDCLNEQMTCQLRNSDFKLVKNHLPVFSPRGGFELLASLKNLMNTLVATGQDISFYMVYTAYVYNLCDALWGKIDDQCMYDYDKDTIRKNRLGHWLKDVVYPYVGYRLENQLISHETEQILAYLSGNRLDEAAECALEQDNPRLAMLISQLPHSEITKKTILQQLTLWQESNISEHMNIHVKKIYMLLAGIPAMDSGDEEFINVCEDMNWVKTFAIYLWYICSIPKKIDEIVATYEKAVDKYGCADKPTPLYNMNIPDIVDLSYHMIKYYCDVNYPLDAALNPNTHTCDVLDYSASWFLIQVMKSLNVCPISPEVQKHITLNFAAQLGSVHLWHWSVFVLQHLTDIDLRDHLISDIIERNIELLPTADRMYHEKEKMLIRDFAIPRPVVDDAKAVFALLCESYSEAVHYLTYAEKFARMHEILFDHVLPDHFICYDYTFLRRFIASLQDAGLKLFNWRGTGALMLDVLDLVKIYNNILEEKTTIEENVSKLIELIISINARYPNFPRKTYLHDICLYEMSNRIMDIVCYITKNGRPEVRKQMSRVKFPNITKVSYETNVREMHWKIGNYILTFVPKITTKPSSRLNLA